MLSLSEAALAAFDHRGYKRRVLLHGRITRQKTAETMRELTTQDIQSNLPIVLEVDSYGGKYHPGLELAKFIPTLRSPVYAVAYGQCYSTALIVYEACLVRLAIPRATFLLHNAYTEIPELRLTADSKQHVLAGLIRQEIRKRKITRAETLDRLNQRTGRPKRALLTLMRKNKILSAAEALAFGFVDQIVPS
jgi:ATP-dependent protease ClpP protease subunit